MNGCMIKAIGTEHEYSINDANCTPLPISDRILERIHGRVEHEVSFGGILVSKELQKHAIELIPARPGGLGALEESLYHGLLELYRATCNEYAFMGLGMHPLLTLDQTACWDHDEQEYYEVYDRLFDIDQHGWLNIQALQINVPYSGGDEMTSMFNRVRALIPYLVAVSASSPFVEGALTSKMDNRLIYYRKNQDAIPDICHGILPERLASFSDAVQINRRIYSELRRRQADILCREWVNSRGVIVRFTRSCLEIKAIDEQECLRSDMAVSAFLLALLRSEVVLEEDERSLLDMLDSAIERGVSGLRPELQRLYSAALKTASTEEMRYLPIIKRRIEEGSLAEVMAQRQRAEGLGRDGIKSIMRSMQWCLRENQPYGVGMERCG